MVIEEIKPTGFHKLLIEHEKEREAWKEHEKERERLPEKFKEVWEGLSK